MGPIHYGTLLLTLTAIVVILSSPRSLLDALIEAIHNFRGGPPTAMHPSPADDSALVARRKN